MVSKNDSELVIGIVQAAGTDSGHVLADLENELRDNYGYIVHRIKVSKDVLGQFDCESHQFANEYERATHYIQLGNDVRKFTGNNAVLMDGVMANIHYVRLKNSEDGKEGPLKRVAHVIDSIKHPDEIDALRATYGDGLHLIGIFDSYDNRLKYLQNRKRLSEDKARELLERDEGEEASYGQHTRDAFQESDYFISVSNDVDFQRANVDRLLALLFGNPYITPTFGEYAMFRAYVTSLRSADLSRQIGAVVTRGDEVVAEGANDCSKVGGGPYWQSYDKVEKKYCDLPAGRDYMLGYDPNKRVQSELIEQILDALGADKTDENIKRVKNAGVGLLTEYGRVVHGEMEALSMCVRNGISTRGCEMYMTTFPCHNCAKHIIAAGIKRVIYIEPYPKSKALEFHEGEVTRDNRDESKVRFIPFYGVGPRRFADLFAMKSTRWGKRTRKDKLGNTVKWVPEEASLRMRITGSDYLNNEQSAYLRFTDTVEDYKVSIRDGLEERVDSRGEEQL